MRRILEFLIAQRNLLLFLLLEIFALVSVFRFHNYHKSVFLNNANAVGASVHKTQTKWKNYFALEELNQSLAVQNAALLSNKRDTVYLSEQDSTGWFAKLDLSNFEVISGSIIFNTVNRPNNTFVIDKGYKHGIEKGLGVASSKGIIGKVIVVNANYSLCLSILNLESPVVMPKVAELKNKSGSIEWKGLNHQKVKLKEIHKFEQMEKGFHIVSSGYSINFPENIPVGTVEKLSKGDGSFYNIDVRLAADLSKDKFAFVFKNINRNEIDSLISSPNYLNK